MRIIEVHIYGYGKLEDYHLSSLNQLQVFYGENEAGKSTIMSFIHSILFGFPAKQSQELRYEPKNHSKYGGRLKAVLPEAGTAVIERVKGKAAGDVTVSLEDGTIGGEELLKDLLGRIDKTIFQAIFSFSVHGLQDIHSMKGDELGRYLFSAGTLGTDKLFHTESRLQKEMEQRFKPGGKKPLLNEKLKELREAQASLKNAEMQNDRYSLLLTEKKAAESRISELDTEISSLERRMVKLRELKRSEQIVIEEAGLSKRITGYGPLFFPEDGLARFEKIVHQLNPIQARLLWIEDKLISLNQESEACRYDGDLLGMETEIAARVENLPLNEQLRQEKKLLEMKVDELSEEISQINENLHTAFNEETINQINTSIFIKEKAEKIQYEQQRLQERKVQLETSFDEEKAKLVQLEASSSAIDSQLLSEEEKSHLAAELAAYENQESQQAELTQVKMQISAHTERSKNDEIMRKSQKKADLFQLILLGTILLAIFIWGIANSQWFLAGAGFIGLLFLVAIHQKKSVKHRQRAVKDEVLGKLLQREHVLSELLQTHSAENLYSSRSRLAKDENLRQRKREMDIRIQEQTSRYEKVIDQFEKWEADDALIRKERRLLVEELGLPESPWHTKIFDAFLLIEKQKQYFRERRRAQEKLRTVSERLAELDTGLLALAKRFLQNPNLSPSESASLLKMKLREAIELNAKFQEVHNKKDELLEERNILEKDLLVLSNEREKLFSQANAQNEDEFRLQAKNAELLKKWVTRQEDLQLQLAGAGISEFDKEEILSEGSLEAQLNAHAQNVEIKKKEQSEQFEMLAQVKHKMAVLEEGGLYSEQLHSYKQLKHEFEEDAKEWAIYAVAKDLLAKTIERYKVDVMPKMLGKAERFLSHLTDGAYVRIIPQSTGSGFLIERNDHVLFEANELSQATAEQVYLSIRLALASVHAERYPFPIIIDDSFVNFDHIRTERIIDLLREFHTNQILIFTCHRHVLGYFTEKEIIPLRDVSPKMV